MPDIAQTNAQLAAQINALLTKWNAREAEFRDWLGGAANAGPNGDGKFPLTDASGRTQLVLSLPALSDTISGPAALSRTAQLLSEAARDAALGYRNSAQLDASAATSAKVDALAARDLAKQYRDDIAAKHADVGVWTPQVITARDVALGARNEALGARDVAITKADEAAASATLAATFNPANFYTKVAADARYQLAGNYVRTDADSTVTGSKFLKFHHASEADINDGKIGAGLFGSGLSIVGVQTQAGEGRVIRLWTDKLLTGQGDTYYHSGNLPAFAAAGHNHDGVYAPAGHNHDAVYVRRDGGAQPTAALQIANWGDVNWDMHLELYQEFGTANRPISLRFHQGNRWWHRIEASAGGFALKQGGAETLVGLNAADIYSNGVKVSVEGHSHSYLPLTGGVLGAGSVVQIAPPAGAGFSGFALQVPGDAYSFGRTGPDYVNAGVPWMNNGKTVLYAPGLRVGGAGANNYVEFEGGGGTLSANWLKTRSGGIIGAGYLTVRSDNGLALEAHDGTLYGYVYSTPSYVGFLNKHGSWAVRADHAGGGELYGTWQLANVNASGHIKANTGRIEALHGFRPIGVGGDSGAAHEPYSFGYQEPGPWTHPYPDLIIGFHTGIKFGASVGYGGMRFYSDHPSQPAAELFSIGNGDNHVRVANQLIVGSFLQANGILMSGTTAVQWSNYNSPQALTFGDLNWAYGIVSDGSQYYMQVKFSGTGDENRGFRVLDVTGLDYGTEVELFRVTPSVIRFKGSSMFRHADKTKSGGRVFISSSQPSGMVDGDIWLQPV